MIVVWDMGLLVLNQPEKNLVAEIIAVPKPVGLRLQIPYVVVLHSLRRVIVEIREVLQEHKCGKIFPSILIHQQEPDDLGHILLLHIHSKYILIFIYGPKIQCTIYGAMMTKEIRQLISDQEEVIVIGIQIIFQVPVMQIKYIFKLQNEDEVAHENSDTPSLEIQRAEPSRLKSPLLFPKRMLPFQKSLYFSFL